jgi:hypothetical protein
MSLNLKTKIRITERGGSYFLQEKRFFRWVDCFGFSGSRAKPYPFNKTKHLRYVISDEIWWQIIKETRKHDNKLFIRETKK